MRRTVFDQIQQTIRDLTTVPPGLVSNLHGVVDETVRIATQPEGQSWYVLSTPVAKAPSLRDFVDAFSYNKTAVSEATTTDGIITYPAHGSITAGYAVAFVTSIDLNSPLALPLQISAPGSQISIYVDNVSLASGVGVLAKTGQLTAGHHIIVVLVYGGTAPVAITAPTSVSLVKTEPAPDPPILIGEPVATYLKAGNGSYAVNLSWQNDPYASAWQVYRALAVESGTILLFTPVVDDTAVVRIDQDLTKVQHGTLFLTKLFLGGQIQNIVGIPDSTGAITASDIYVILDRDAPTDSTSWVGETYMRSTEQYMSIAHVTYSGSPTITFLDSTVADAAVYLYRVTAFGFITGTTESDFSAPGWVYVKDLTPPASIEIDDPNSQIQVVAGELFLSFIAPSDADYRGIKVFVEDELDPTTLINVASEHGLPSLPDTVSVRLPRAGTYHFCTYDWAGNTEPEGYVWVWDGTSQGTDVLTAFLTSVDNGDGTASLSLILDGSSDLFPATVIFFSQTTDALGGIDLGGGVVAATVISAGTTDKTVYPVLGTQPIPVAGLARFWANVVDAQGVVHWAFTVVDRGPIPGGEVVPDDYTSFPSLTCIFDDDVSEIDISLNGTVVQTYTRTSGLPSSGGGEVTYTVPTPIPSDGSVSGYVVTYSGNGTTLTLWSGKLHGQPSNPPTLDTRWTLDATLRNAADVFVKLGSPVGEEITLNLKDGDDPSLPLWQVVTANGVTTLKYVASGTEIGPTDFFYNATSVTWEQKLNNVALKQGQTKYFFVQAVGKDTGVESAWSVVALPLQEVPVIESTNLSYNEGASELRLTAFGGAFCESAKFEFSTDATFASGVTTSQQSLVSAAQLTIAHALGAGDKNQTWYGRVTPFNGPLVSGAVTGLGGIPGQDSTFVSTAVGDQPSGTVDLQTDFSGNLTLIVSLIGNAQSFGYTTSATAYDFTQADQTLVNFGSASFVDVALGTLASGDTKYVVVWLYSGTSGAGTVGTPISKSIQFGANLQPSFDYIIQAQDTAITTEPRVNFTVRITDPSGLGGTLRAWVNKDSTSSPNPAVTQDGSLAIASTPIVVDKNGFSLLHDVLSNSQQDKIVWFEFINSAAISTGKIAVKVTTFLVDIDNKGKIAPGVVDITAFASGLTPIQTVTSLPGTGTTGAVVFLTTDKKLYRWTGTAWTAAFAASDITGTITGTQIANDAITTPKIATGAVIADSIAANSITGDKLVANSITAGLIAAATITGDKIAANTIAGNNIKANTITGDLIAANTIFTKNLAITNTDNLVPNPESESGSAATGKDPEGNGLVSDPTNAFTGSWCRRISAAAPSTTTVTGVIPCAPGDQFYAECHAKVSAAGPTAFISLVFLSATGTTLSTANSNANSSTAYALVSLTTIAPANTVSCRLSMSSGGTFGSGKFSYFDAFYMRRMADGKLIVDGSISAVKLSATAIQTSNYAEDVSGNPTAGARMQVTGTSLKVAPNNVQVGEYLLTDAFFRAINALANNGTGSTARTWYRGNDDATVRGGVPNVSCLKINTSTQQPANGRIWLDFRLQPTTFSDNLDGVRYIKVEIFFNTSGTTLGTLQTIYVPISDRVYANPNTDSDNNNASASTWYQQTTFSCGATTVDSPRLYLRCAVWNVYGPSDTHWFIPPSFAGTGTTVSTGRWTDNGLSAPSGFTNVSGGSTNAGSGGGGTCPAPDTRIACASGEGGIEWICAGDLAPGKLVFTKHETTGEWGYFPVTAVLLAEAECYKVTFDDGRQLTASWNHRVYTKDGWAPILSLPRGRLVLGSRPGFVQNVERVGTHPVVKIAVEGAHTYVTEGFLSHNIKAFL